jgi:prepilin-type N-terminal cleavage/methylation domain-containing protein
MIAPRRSVRGFSIIELLVVLAVGVVVMAIGTPVLRGALGEQRLVAGATELSSAMLEARRLAIRANQSTRVEVNPADGRISVFAVNTNTNAEVEARRTYLPPGVGFETLMIITNYSFDSLGRPASLPMSIGVQAEASGAVRTVTVLGSGRVEVE